MVGRSHPRVIGLLAAVLSLCAFVGWSASAAPKHHKQPKHHKHHGPRPRPKPPPPPAGTLDSTLGSGGVETVPVGSLAVAAAGAVQADGKIVTVGEATVNGHNVFVSTRMNRDGSLDSTFGHRGVAIPDPSGEGGGNAVAFQRDGKLLLAGAARAGNVLSFGVVRLLSNGAIDPTFGHGGVATVTIGSEAIANAIAIQPDGKILLGGTSLNGRLSFTAARLSPDGSVDRSFGSRGVSVIGPAGAAWGMVLQPDGRIVLAGELGNALSYGLLGALSALLPGGGLNSIFQAGDQDMVARLLPNGAPDSSFGSGGVVTIPYGQAAVALAVALQPDGKIVISGNAFTDRVLALTFRLLPNGQRDPAFGSRGAVALEMAQAINALALQANGSVILAGVGPIVVRLDGRGRLDPSFGHGGIFRTSLGSGAAANGVTIDRLGKLVLTGAANVAGRTVLTVMRLNA